MGSMDLSVDRQSEQSVTAQLMARLRTAIEQGELRPGDRLPSLRRVATAAEVNVNTVRAVYARLEAVGVVSTEQGRGTFVTKPAAGGERGARRELLDDIARLEAEVVRLPLLPAVEPTGARPRSPRLLSADELRAVRDLLEERVRELRSARAEIVGRIGRQSLPAPPEPARAPALRSSSTRAGARVRWTGA
jgi:DNA-binding transcriptional regulator YhcF (GntR family)